MKCWQLEKGANNFDFLRFLFAALVIYSHSFALLLTAEVGYRGELFQRLTRGQITGGELAVDAFFAISGLLVVQSWMRSGSLWVYLAKRILRIYPAFILAAVLCALLFGPLGARSISGYYASLSLPRWAVSTLHLSVWVPAVFCTNPVPGAINGSAWSILYEFWCYLLVAGLGLLGVYRKPMVVVALFVAAVAVYGLQLLHGGRFFLLPPFFHYVPVPFAGQWPRLLSFFLAGTGFYFYRARIPASPRWLALSLGVLGALSLAGVGLQLALPVFGTYALFYLAFNPQLRLQHFAKRGDLSYGVYLYAFPIQQLLVMYWRPYLNPYSLFLVSLAITCGFALMSWRLVEKPSLRLKSRSRLAHVAFGSLETKGAAPGCRPIR